MLIVGRSGRVGSHHSRCRLAQLHRVERLDDPCVGLGLAGKVRVGVAVEEHDHTLGRDAPGPLFQPQVQAGGHSAHVPDLEVKYDQVGLMLANRGQDLVAAGHADDTALASQRGFEFLMDMIGQCGY